jgi:hypothetical protein
MVDRHPEIENSMDRVWKEFGKQTEAGKLLYDLYGVRFRPERFVKYPKLKMKTEEEKLLEDKKNKTVKPGQAVREAARKIDYPDVNPYRNKSNYKFSKIDLIPKRKNEAAIKKELDVIKNNMIIHSTRPTQITNRKTQIESLQDKFMFQERTVMPKGARLPAMKFKSVEDQVITEQAQVDLDQTTKKRFTSKKEELQYLYSQIMKEIDERYAYMEELKSLGQNKDNIIMGEIKDRIEELKKIKKMLESA